MVLLFKIKNAAQESVATVGDTDFKGHYEGINKNCGWISLSTSIRKVTRDYIIPHIGQALYDDLAAKYQDATMVGDPEDGFVLGDPVNGIILGTGELTAMEFELLNLLRDAIAEYTIWYAARFKLVQFGDAGIRIGVDGGDTNARSPQPWELAQWGFSVMLEADKHLDMALAFLDANKSSFPEYSPAQLPPAKLLVRTTAEFDAIVPIANSRRTFVKLWPNLLNAGPRIVRPIVGQTIYDAVLTFLSGGFRPTFEIDPLLPYMQRVAAHWAAWQGFPRLACVIDEEGVRTVTSSDGHRTKATAHEDRLGQLVRQCENDYLSAREDLVYFLINNTTEYPTWIESEVYAEHNRTDGQGTPYTFGDGGVFLV